MTQRSAMNAKKSGWWLVVSGSSFIVPRQAGTSGISPASFFNPSPSERITPCLPPGRRPSPSEWTFVRADGRALLRRNGYAQRRRLAYGGRWKAQRGCGHSWMLLIRRRNCGYCLRPLPCFAEAATQRRGGVS